MLGFPGDDELDLSVTKIPDPAVEAEGDRPVHSRGTVADTLHSPRDEAADCRRRLTHADALFFRGESQNLP